MSTVEQAETRWMFTPRDPWRAGPAPSAGARHPRGRCGQPDRQGVRGRQLRYGRQESQSAAHHDSVRGAMKPIFLFLSLLAMQAPPARQRPCPNRSRRSVPRIDAAMKIDGILDEAAVAEGGASDAVRPSRLRWRGTRRDRSAHLVRRSRRCIWVGSCEDGDIQATFTAARQPVLGRGGRRVLRHPRDARPLLRAAMESAGRHLRCDYHESTRARRPFEAVQRRLVVHGAQR